LWPNPNEFNPIASRGRQSYVYLPFGAHATMLGAAFASYQMKS